jgi:hypothetical protein
MAEHSTLSNASKSILTIFLFDLWQRNKYSKSQDRQSWIVLLLMKPYWLDLTRSVIERTRSRLKGMSILKTITLCLNVGKLALNWIGKEIPNPGWKGNGFNFNFWCLGVFRISC